MSASTLDLGAPPVLVGKQLQHTRSQLREDATAFRSDGDTVVLRCSRHEVPLRGLSPASTAVLAALADGPLDDAGLVAVAERAEPGAGMSTLLRATVLVQRLAGAGWLDELLYDGDRRVAGLHHALIGTVPPAVPVPAQPRLSRFATLAPERGALRARSPRGTATVSLVSPAAVGVALALCHEPGGDLDTPVAQAVLRLLSRSGLLTSAGPAGDPEVVDPRLAQWSPAELAFHASSRAGRSLGGYGGTYALRGRVPELPAVVAPTGPVVALPQPDLAAGPAATASFGTVLEQRRTVREHDDAAPIDVAQLSELLYRTARERRRFVDEDGTELSERPYPCGGARYELEIYPVVTRCGGLEPGVYRYLADRHALELVAADSPSVQAFLGLVGATGLFTRPPQVALVVTARFGRVMAKYEAMAYALVLKHVGVLYQSLYLTCTAMGLAACGLGGGDADAFARLTGRDYYAESSVGELLVGSRPAG